MPEKKLFSRDIFSITPSQLKRMVLRVLIGVVCLFAVFCISVVSAFYYFLPRLDSFRPQITAFVSKKLNSHVTVTHLQGNWQGINPRIIISNLQIQAPNHPPGLIIPQSEVVFSWRSLFALTPIFNHIELTQPIVQIIRNKQRQLIIAGILSRQTDSSDHYFLSWLMQQQYILVNDATVAWHDYFRNVPILSTHHLQLSLINQQTRHQFQAFVPKQQSVLEAPVDLSAEFSHPLFADPGDIRYWQGTGKVNLNHVNLPKLVGYFPPSIVFKKGNLKTNFIFHFKNQFIQSMKGILEGENLVLQSRPFQPTYLMPRVQTNWELSISPNEYWLNLTNFNATIRELSDTNSKIRQLKFNQLDGHYRSPTLSKGQLFGVSSDQVNLDLLGQFLLALPLPLQIQDEILRYNPHGSIDQFHLEVERERLGYSKKNRANPTKTPIIKYQLKGLLKGVSIAPQQPPEGLSKNGNPRIGIPGVENLWGTIEASETGGLANINSANTTLYLPGALDNPNLPLKQINGVFNWTISHEPLLKHAILKIQGDNIYLKNQDIEGTIRFQFDNSKHKNGHLKLTANIEQMNLYTLKHYLPTSVSINLRNFLGHALESGTLQKPAQIIIDGPLDKFPFSKYSKAGIFQIDADFKNMRFNPSPWPLKSTKEGHPNIWPSFSQINGHFSLYNQQMNVNIAQGLFKNFQLKHVKVAIDNLSDLAQQPLSITGEGKGPLNDALEFVNQSPIQYHLPTFARPIHGQGTAQLQVDLRIPLHPNEQNTQFKTAIKLLNNNVQFANLPVLKNTQGTVNITDQSLDIHAQQMNLLGEPFNLNGSMKFNDQLQFAANGKINFDRIDPNIFPPLWGNILKNLHGIAPYAINLKGKSGTLPNIHLSTNLNAIESSLPAPFNKAKGQKMPFELQIQPSATEHTQTLNFQLGPLRARYLIETNSLKNIRVPKGVITLNNNLIMPKKGVVSNINFQTFNLDQWMKILYTPSSSSASSSIFSLFIPQYNQLKADQLIFLNRLWENVHLEARYTPKSLNAKLSANGTSGHISWFFPQKSALDTGFIRAQFPTLTIPDVLSKDHLSLESETTLSPSTPLIPGVDLKIDQLYFNKKSLGKLNIQAHNERKETGEIDWNLDKLELINPNATLDIDGSWANRVHHGQSIGYQTHLKLNAKISDLGNLLTELGLPDTIKKGECTIEGHLSWLNKPSAIDYSSLNGKINLNMKNGNLLKINAGAANLLSVLSLQSLFQNLTGGFKNISATGLNIDKIHSDATVKEGIMHFDNFEMHTSIANIFAAGDINLINQTQKIEASVEPKVGTGTAALALAVLANPIIGLGMLSADLTLSPALAKIFTQHYIISGSWQKPLIEKK